MNIHIHVGFASSELENELLTVYGKWAKALEDKDFKEIEATMSKPRLIFTRNLIVSKKQKYPETFLEMDIPAPGIRNLELVEAKAYGNTAHLVYFGPVKWGGEIIEPEGSILVLDFEREQGQWKFDSTRLLPTRGMEKAREWAKQKSPELLQHPAIALTGRALPTPALCPEPDYVAVLEIEALGVDVQASIGAFSYTPVGNDVSSHLLMGGLKYGDNPMTLQVKTRPGAAPQGRFFEVNVFVMPPGKPDLAKKIFSERRDHPSGRMSFTIKAPKGLLPDH